MIAKRKNSASPPDKPQRSRTERNKLDKLKRIRRAAATLFRKHGFDGTTTQVIAEAADIGIGTLFMYAPKKENLLSIVMDNELIETVDELAGSIPQGQSLAKQVWHIFGGLIEFHSHEKELSRLYVREVTTPRNFNALAFSGRSPGTAITNMLTNIVSHHQDLGHLRRNVSAETMAEGLFSLYYMGLLRYLGRGSTAEECAATVREHIRLYCEGINLPR
jgi:AcrR family transcriptional regulator